MDNIPQRIWKEAAVAKFEVLSRHLNEGTVWNEEKILVSIAEIWILDLQNTEKQFSVLGHNFHLLGI
jgi:hypothetical protein